MRRVKAKARSSAIAIIDLDVRGQLAQTIQRSTFSRRDRAVISARQAGHCVIRAMLGALARSEAGWRPAIEADSEVPPGSLPSRWAAVLELKLGCFAFIREDASSRSRCPPSLSFAENARLRYDYHDIADSEDR